MADDDSDPTRVLEELGLTALRGRPVIAVFGGADRLGAEAERRATELIGPGVTSAARTTGATIVDGGTAAGVMSIVGEAVAKSVRPPPILLGVAPEALVESTGAPDGAEVPLEPNHSHFVLTPGRRWGAETEPLFALVDALAEGSRVVAVSVGGGSITKAETLGAVRRSWPVFVAEQTDGFADLVATRRRALRPSSPTWTRRLLPRPRREHGTLTDDPELDEIARSDAIRLLAGAEEDVARELAWELQEEGVLKGAWRSFATYDALANGARRTFSGFQGAVLIVGLGGTFLALLEDSVGFGGRAGAVVHWTVVAVPIVVSLLIAVTARIGFGRRWVLLRGAAEATKSEIFRSRTRTGVYADDALTQAGLTRDEALAVRLNAIDARLLQTEASGGALTPYDGPLPPKMYGASARDDGLSPLDADGYLLFRVGDQLNYFHPKVVQLNRRLRVFQLVALTVGAAGTVLAAAGLETWIGLTTAIAAAAVAYLATLQVEPTLVAYNQAAGKLESLRRLWGAQPVQSHDFDRLVNEAEGVLATELSGWVQQMNQAIEEAARKGETPPHAAGGT